MDQNKNGWMVGWMIKQIDRWLEGKQKYEKNNGWMVGWIEKIDGWLDEKKKSI